jgi:chromosome partitioning protein
MIITVTSCKGGVCKTTASVQLAAFLESLFPGKTALLDGDPRKFATAWSKRGAGLGFPVASSNVIAKYSREYEHLVIDSAMGEKVDELLEAMVEISDEIVIPVLPSWMEQEGLLQTLLALQEIPGAKYRALLARVASHETAEATRLREELAEIGAPVFAAEVPWLKAFQKAAKQGVCVRDAIDPRAAEAWAAYEAVGKELLRWG